MYLLILLAGLGAGPFNNTHIKSIGEIPVTSYEEYGEVRTWTFHNRGWNKIQTTDARLVAMKNGIVTLGRDGGTAKKKMYLGQLHMNDLSKDDRTWVQKEVERRKKPVAKTPAAKPAQKKLGAATPSSH
jgi:hypothetical protein